MPDQLDEAKAFDFAFGIAASCEAVLLSYASKDWTPIDKTDPDYLIIDRALRLMKAVAPTGYAPFMLPDEYREMMKSTSSQPELWLSIFERDMKLFGITPLSLAKQVGPRTCMLAEAVLGMSPSSLAKKDDREQAKLGGKRTIGIDLIAHAYIESTSLLTKTREESLIVLPEPSIQIVNDWQEIISHISRDSAFLYQLNWKRFEDLIGYLLNSFGWSIEPMGYTKDGGIDIIAARKLEPDLDFRMMVQCKRASATRRIGIEVVRELWAVKSDNRFHDAMIATTSIFTKGAVEKAHLWNLTLKDHAAITDWCRTYQARNAALRRSNEP